ncbi:MAG: NUDIX domain-containing protein [Candidatus Woesearchaeota archaeon]|nr:NUDIX domain-containing protein [Candidatus Woesearchaeota archaeon]
MKLEFSAGGVVIKKDSSIKVLIAQHSQHHGWVFPKGLIDENPSAGSGQGETKEEAALREVQEETGVTGKILESLIPITYWYVYEGEKRQKTVYYFLMEYISGDITEHDWEMENVEWLPVEKVEKRLTYPSDKKVWKEAKEQITKHK